MNMAINLPNVALSFIMENGLILTFATLVSFYLLKPYLDPKRKHLPPGPTGIPILGYIPFMQGEYGVQLQRLFAKYGKIVSMRLGSMDVVFISDFEVIKKIMKNDDFNNRPDFYMFSITNVPNFVNCKYNEKKARERYYVCVVFRL